MNSNVHSCILTIFANLRFYFWAFNHLFDSGRMIRPSTISFQELHVQLHDGSTKADNTTASGVSSNKIHTCKCLKSTDITAFTTNNPSLHLIARKLNNRNGSFSYMVNCTFLDGIDNIFLSLSYQLLPCPAFHPCKVWLHPLLHHLQRI